MNESIVGVCTVGEGAVNESIVDESIVNASIVDESIVNASIVDESIVDQGKHQVGCVYLQIGGEGATLEVARGGHSY